ncbi:energy transducer TonB [Halobacteriovorax sp. HLS]|uniref:energy transducer TonB n=1 Tax=Halobacteriovorax sp. HLS TaxID=2234000 RepID=UPI000FDCB9F1|nr:energy transducer TonB [Halobacteriovorax sp. HLS]
MFDLLKEKSFKIAMVLSIVFHCGLFYKSQENIFRNQQAAAVQSSNQKLRISLRKRTPKKKVVPKKVVKSKKKKSPKKIVKKEVVEQRIEKVQAAIMKTVYNHQSKFSPTPRYPRRAQKRSQQGKVLVSIFIAENGSAYDAKIIESSGYKLLDDAALRTALEWKFAPAIHNGVPIKSVNNQSFVFSLQN